ncbi:MAG: crossover junction endodeoxyribonuclease RuvC, partial [Prevotellaceae bacterium]|nr:crossover junction endodeoxyribonuclease RuvC [Prevotellaceae bacterium]
MPVISKIKKTAALPERVIMGIDPGTTVMGYGIIRVSGNVATLVVLGSLSLYKYDDHYTKLQRIFERVTQLID